MRLRRRRLFHDSFADTQGAVGASPPSSGLLNKQIAAALRTTEMTVRVHPGSVMRKMAAESLAQLVRMADWLGRPTLEALYTNPRGS